MSWIKCHDCYGIFDSDDDPDCFVGDDAVQCERCREAEERDHYLAQKGKDIAKGLEER